MDRLIDWEIARNRNWERDREMSLIFLILKIYVHAGGSSRFDGSNLHNGEEYTFSKYSSSNKWKFGNFSDKHFKFIKWDPTLVFNILG